MIDYSGYPDVQGQQELGDTASHPHSPHASDPCCTQYGLGLGLHFLYHRVVNRHLLKRTTVSQGRTLTLVEIGRGVSLSWFC